MSLSPNDVKRTWQVHNCSMEYRMEVHLASSTKVSAIKVISGSNVDLRCQPPAYIEQDLQDKIMNHIRSELFGKP